MERDAPNPSLSRLARELLDPLERLLEEAEALPKGKKRARLLKVARELSNLIGPLAESGPVLAFRRAPVPNAPEMPQRRVLIVEGEPSARHYMSRLLELEGFDVASASSLLEGWKLAEAMQPDVVTVDNLLLQLDDGNWLRRFKADRTLGRIPLVVVRTPEAEESLVFAGVTSTVSKPIDPGELACVIRSETGESIRSALLVGPDEAALPLLKAALDAMKLRAVTVDSVAEASETLARMIPAVLLLSLRSISESRPLLEQVPREVFVVALHEALTTGEERELSRMVDARLSTAELTPAALVAALRGAAERRPSAEAEVS